MERHYLGKDLAKLAGWQRDYLSRIEQGKWRVIDPAKLIALARALHCSIDQLLGHNGAAP
jgi:transcriptional regulator with XRE-family HTH domain